MKALLVVAPLCRDNSQRCGGGCMKGKTCAFYVLLNKCADAHRFCHALSTRIVYLAAIYTSLPGRQLH